MGREIKRSVVVEAKKEQPGEGRDRSRERSRERTQEPSKKAEVQEISSSQRRQLLKKMRARQEEQDQYLVLQPNSKPSEVFSAEKCPTSNSEFKIKTEQGQLCKNSQPVQEPSQHEHNSQAQQSMQQKMILHKPVYIGKEQRETIRIQDAAQQKQMEEQSKKIKIGRQNTKLLLNETLKAEGEQNQGHSGSDSDDCDMPNDDDTKDEALEYEYWKIRELKRIRRDKQERNKFAIQQADVERRRKMTDQERLAENKRLGSDLTDNTQTNKYVFMQKYYHRGAYYQDSQESVMKKDYNLPTAMELQDKTMLPKILQKRRNDFGMKGQSKHTHLADVDTTNHDPRTKANEGVMIALQKKMAGYKDSFLQNKR